MTTQYIHLPEHKYLKDIICAVEFFDNVYNYSIKKYMSYIDLNIFHNQTLLSETFLN
jgi:hypothetical protein